MCFIHGKRIGYSYPVPLPHIVHLDLHTCAYQCARIHHRVLYVSVHSIQSTHPSNFRIPVLPISSFVPLHVISHIYGCIVSSRISFVSTFFFFQSIIRLKTLLKKFSKHSKWRRLRWSSPQWCPLVFVVIVLESWWSISVGRDF